MSRWTEIYLVLTVNIVILIALAMGNALPHETTHGGFRFPSLRSVCTQLFVMDLLRIFVQILFRATGTPGTVEDNDTLRLMVFGLAPSVVASWYLQTDPYTFWIANSIYSWCVIYT